MPPRPKLANKRSQKAQDTSTSDALGGSSSRPVKRAKNGNFLKIGSQEDDEPPLPDPADTGEAYTDADRDTAGLTAVLPAVTEAVLSEEAEEVEGEVKATKYTSSLYTDAFSMALDTVLEQESHLFNEEEAEIFQKYKSLPYEAQYLYSSISYHIYQKAYFQPLFV